MLTSFIIIKIIQLQVYLLICFRAAETLTDRLVDLGQNVSLNCDFDVKEVNWLLLKLPDPPVLILLSSTTAATFHYSKTYKQKYSVQSKHHLFIINVTVDELGLYYCVTKDQKYSDGTKLHITEQTAEIQNRTVEVKTHIEENQRQWQIISLIFALLNVLLFIVIIGLVKVFVLGRKRTRDNLERSQDAHPQPPVMDLQSPQTSGQAQHATANISKPCKRFQSITVNSTYALLQLPK